MKLVDILAMPNGLDKAKELAIDGLLTDGGWHKQWFLEKILESLGVDLVTLRKELQTEDYDWEPGTPP